MKTSPLLKNIIYALASISFAIVIGAAVYEHLAVVPRWSIGPPASLAMFQGDYGLKPDIFWMMIHPVSLLLLITALVLHRKSDRKKHLVTTLTGYVTVLVITFIYFVPELIAITTTPYSTAIDQDLTNRAQLWETLSLVRLAFLIVMAVYLNIGMAKSEEKSSGF